MTREEIIKGFESVKTECGKHLDEGFAWICKPIDEDIEVLKREPSTDAVSREYLLSKAYAYGNGSEPDGYCVEVEDIQNAPPVTPERPKGKWIWKERTKGGFATYTGENAESGERVSVSVDERIKTKVNYCSVCGKRGDDTFFNFCPNCGADMREVSE